MPSIPLLRLEVDVTPERLEEIKQYAEVRLRSGDLLAAYSLELAAEIKAAAEEIIRLRRHLGEIP